MMQLSAKNASSAGIFTAIENDFPFGTDRYYTQGLFVGFSSDFIPEIPLFGAYFDGKDTRKKSIEFSHKMFTPENLSSPAIDSSDRPFAAVLSGKYTALFRMSGSLFVEESLEFGLIGPAAGGEAIQSGIHSWNENSTEPLGWENQIANSPVINYSLSAIKRNSFLKHYAHWDYLISVTVGTGEVSGGGGLEFAFKYPRLNEVISLHISGNLDYLLYDATLQSGIVTISPYKISSNQINPWIAAGEIRLKLNFKGFGMDVYSRIRSREIVTTGLIKYAGLNLSIDV
jgi:hypothetical protein